MCIRDRSLFDNEHTVYETVKVGEADGVLGTSTDEHGKNVYTLSWEHRGITPVSYTHLDVYKRQGQ